MEVIMSELNEKKGAFSTKEVSDFVQSEVQNVLFECPKCDCPQTKITGKKSYFGAIGSLFIGFIPAFFAPVIIGLKVLIYIGTFKFNKLRKMIIQELWSKYVLWGKCWLIILTFGIVNLTKVYTCEKCGKKWVV
jgi:predicted RNA-binding Zn-ribbon protein involved in translation (DUF1610 family)